MVAALARNRAWYGRNREAQRARSAAWKLANPEKAKAARDAHRAWDVAWLRNQKIGKSCVDCKLGCTAENFIAFDWDHRPGVIKLFAVSQAFRTVSTNEEILAEIAKCDLRCRNCHAIVTLQRTKEGK